MFFYRSSPKSSFLPGGGGVNPSVNYLGDQVCGISWRAGCCLLWIPWRVEQQYQQPPFCSFPHFCQFFTLSPFPFFLHPQRRKNTEKLQTDEILSRVLCKTCFLTSKKNQNTNNSKEVTPVFFFLPSLSPQTSSLYSRVKLLDGAPKFAFSKNLRTSPLARGNEEERGAKKQESTRTRRFIMGSQTRLCGWKVT